MAPHTPSPPAATPERPPRGRRLLRRLLILGLATFLLLSLLLALLPTILSSIPTGRVLQSQVNPLLAGRVEIEGLRLGWLGTQRIRSLAVYTPEGDRVLLASAIEYRGGLAALVLGNRDVRLAIEQLHLDITADEAGSPNLLDVLPPAETPPTTTDPAPLNLGSLLGPWPLPVSSVDVAIADLRLVYTDHAGRTLAAREASLKVGWPANGGDLAVSLPVTLEAGGHAEPLDLRVTLSGFTADGAIHFDGARFDLALAANEASLLRVTTLLASREVTTTATLGLAPLPGLLRLAGVPLPPTTLDGSLEADLVVEDLGGTLEVTTSARMEGAAVRGELVPTGGVAVPPILLDAKATLDATTFAPGEASAALDWPLLAARASHRPGAARIEIDWTAPPSLDLARAAGFLPPGIPAIEAALRLDSRLVYTDEGIASLSANAVFLPRLLHLGGNTDPSLANLLRTDPLPLDPFSVELEAVHTFATHAGELVLSGPLLDSRWDYVAGASSPMASGGLSINITDLGTHLRRHLAADLPPTTGTLRIDALLGTAQRNVSATGRLALEDFAIELPVDNVAVYTDQPELDWTVILPQVPDAPIRAQLDLRTRVYQSRNTLVLSRDLAADLVTTGTLDLAPFAAGLLPAELPRPDLLASLSYRPGAVPTASWEGVRLGLPQIAMLRTSGMAALAPEATRLDGDLALSADLGALVESFADLLAATLDGSVELLGTADYTATFSGELPAAEHAGTEPLATDATLLTEVEYGFVSLPAGDFEIEGLRDERTVRIRPFASAGKPLLADAGRLHIASVLALLPDESEIIASGLHAATEATMTSEGAIAATLREAGWEGVDYTGPGGSTSLPPLAASLVYTLGPEARHRVGEIAVTLAGLLHLAGHGVFDAPADHYQAGLSLEMGGQSPLELVLADGTAGRIGGSGRLDLSASGAPRASRHSVEASGAFPRIRFGAGGDEFLASLDFATTASLPGPVARWSLQARIEEATADGDPSIMPMLPLLLAVAGELPPVGPLRIDTATLALPALGGGLSAAASIGSESLPLADALAEATGDWADLPFSAQMSLRQELGPLEGKAGIAGASGSLGLRATLRNAGPTETRLALAATGDGARLDWHDLASLRGLHGDIATEVVYTPEAAGRLQSGDLRLGSLRLSLPPYAIPVGPTRLVAGVAAGALEFSARSEDFLGGTAIARLRLLTRSLFPALELEMTSTGLDAVTLLPSLSRFPSRERRLNIFGAARLEFADVSTVTELLEALFVRIEVASVPSAVLREALRQADAGSGSPGIQATLASLRFSRPRSLVIELRNGLLDVEVFMTSPAGVDFRLPVFERLSVPGLLAAYIQPEYDAYVALARTALDVLMAPNRLAAVRLLLPTEEAS